MTKVATDSYWNIQAYVAYNHDQGAIVIAFRGCGAATGAPPMATRTCLRALTRLGRPRTGPKKRASRTGFLTCLRCGKCTRTTPPPERPRLNTPSPCSSLLQEHKTTTYPHCDCKVEAGFYTGHEALKPQLMPAMHALKSQYPNAPVYVTGHSLGAAMAVLRSVAVASCSDAEARH